LFSGDSVEKRVSVLSGGEKSRLALAKMLLQASNFLILDEPTNHLDMRTKDVLKQALLQFSGTFVVVSHDRYFLEGLVTKVIEMQDGRLMLYPGSFEEFLARKERDGEEKSQKPVLNGVEGSKVKGQMSKGGENTAQLEGILTVIKEAKHGKALHARQKASRADRQKRDRQIAETERRISALEEKQTTLEALMADSTTYTDPQRAKEISTQYETAKRQLEQQYATWSELAGEMDG
jgi:ATP-binding cassette subfamily F protein 3